MFFPFRRTSPQFAELRQLYHGVLAITQDKNGSFTVGGLRPRSTTYNVDGSNNNFEVNSSPRTPVIQAGQSHHTQKH